MGSKDKSGREARKPKQSKKAKAPVSRSVVPPTGRSTSTPPAP